MIHLTCVAHRLRAMVLVALVAVVMLLSAVPAVAGGPKSPSNITWEATARNITWE